MDGKPFGGTATASAPPFLVAGNLRVEHIDLLHTYCITTAHDGGDIVRIKNVFENDCKIILPVGQNGLDAVLPLGCHAGKIRIVGCFDDWQQPVEDGLGFLTVRKKK